MFIFCTIYYFYLKAFKHIYMKSLFVFIFAMNLYICIFFYVSCIFCIKLAFYQILSNENIIQFKI